MCLSLSTSNENIPIDENKMLFSLFIIIATTLLLLFQGTTSEETYFYIYDAYTSPMSVSLLYLFSVSYILCESSVITYRNYKQMSWNY